MRRSAPAADMRAKYVQICAHAPAPCSLLRRWGILTTKQIPHLTQRDNSMRTACVIAFALVATWLPAAGFCGDTDTDSDPGYVPATVTHVPTLSYPTNQMIEALVYVRFLVNEEGVPVEIEVQQDRGFHNEKFREAARKYVEEMRFSPATRDGIPVPWGPVVQPLNFSQPMLAGQVGVRDEFRYELSKVEKLLKNQDFAGANFHAEWMLREKTTLRYEFYVLKAQLAQTNFLAGNYDEALAAAVEASRRRQAPPTLTMENLRQPVPDNDESKYLLPKETVVYLLGLRMQLFAQRGEVTAAIESYNELAGLDRKLKPDDPRAQFAAKLVTLLESGRPLAFNAKMQQKYWPHELFYPRYLVRNLTGQLHETHLHCIGNSRESEYVPDTVWSVPDGWKHCVVEFYGDAGSTFELVELPADTSPAPAN